MLEVKGLCKSFTAQNDRRKTVEAVKNVSFTLCDGELCALVGESGSGKSTLSQMLAGVLPPTAGEILLDGENIAAFGRGKRRRQRLYSKIQLVLQDGKSALDPRFTVYDSIAEPIRNLVGCSQNEEKAKISELMESMELSQELLTRKPSELSGGQQKRVCIARALAPKPKIIIFDEAVSGLDVIVRKNILDLLKRLHKAQKMTYLFITHDMDVALYLADKIFVMKDGEIVERVCCENGEVHFSHPYSRLLAKAMLV